MCTLLRCARWCLSLALACYLHIRYHITQRRCVSCLVIARRSSARRSIGGCVRHNMTGSCARCFILMSMSECEITSFNETMAVERGISDTVTDSH
ncbi:hypothetical protein EDD36DRAFT_292139 [Exophiala viscosa]|uniref:Secreted protein n=1 Tax=Exophiala viscosa TaxID=2486360 RepID=A0AAN6DRV0_9EURO|nr:hypothetical protein EDD36DRAFT_292139 [Exophiala viscosa]